MKWMIVTDTSCDLRELETGSPDIGFATVPFSVIVDHEVIEDTVDLNTAALVEKMEQSAKSSTACPSPEAWAEKFRMADRVIAVTISSRLSGSYNSAVAAKEMVLEEEPDKQIDVIDSLSTGPKLVMLVQAALRLIRGKEKFETVCAACREKAAAVRTIFTLASFHNLVQNGRVNKVVGFLAGKLNIRVIGIGTMEGLIHMKGMVRGDLKALRNIVESMSENGFRGGPVAISHCLNEGMADRLTALIRDKWREATVQVFKTRGLDSYYAERNGLIICY